MQENSRTIKEGLMEKLEENSRTLKEMLEEKVNTINEKLEEKVNTVKDELIENSRKTKEELNHRVDEVFQKCKELQKKDNGHLNVVQINYNENLSSIRSTIECAFGLLKGKFRRPCVIDNYLIDHGDIEIRIVQQDNEENDQLIEPARNGVDASDSDSFATEGDDWLLMTFKRFSFTVDTKRGVNTELEIGRRSDGELDATDGELNPEVLFERLPQEETVRPKFIVESSSNNFKNSA
ncbi:hypothetical protein FQA39_LY15623 [Lamprigera yunnana]|nr:hypothetical protein FQA39_LY15623 [Lamprigera yunnana]